MIPTRLFHLPVFLLLFAILGVSCNESTPAHEEEHEHVATDTLLSLNNGAKWKADLSTNLNVTSLKTASDEFVLISSPAVSNYQELAGRLGDGLKKMISECKMSGPDHDALHKWLEPVLKETQQLKSVSDTTRAKEIFGSLKHRIDEYSQYFE